MALDKPPKCTAAKSKNYPAVMCPVQWVILTNRLSLRYCSLIPRLPPLLHNGSGVRPGNETSFTIHVWFM